MTYPERIAGALIEEVKNHSGVVLEECLVQALREERGGFIVATSSGEFSSTRVVNALGPWISSVELPLGLRGMRPLWCKGFNVVTRTQLHPTHAIGIEGGGRLFFCVPRGEGTSIGTWYVPVNELAVTEKPRVSEEELGQFLAAFNAALPEFQVTPDDIRGVDVGVLPMKRVGPRGPELYGSEIISATRGYTEIVSTKYTTFRSQGVRALDTIR
jgi:glycerol-3-phosphate dehydrogenase